MINTYNRMVTQAPAQFATATGALAHFGRASALQAEGERFETARLHAVSSTLKYEVAMPEVTVPESNPAQEKCDKAAFELRVMIGNGCIDYAKILRILEAKVF